MWPGLPAREELLRREELLLADGVVLQPAERMTVDRSREGDGVSRRELRSLVAADRLGRELLRIAVLVSASLHRSKERHRLQGLRMRRPEEAAPTCEGRVHQRPRLLDASLLEVDSRDPVQRVQGVRAVRPERPPHSLQGLTHEPLRLLEASQLEVELG